MPSCQLPALQHILHVDWKLEQPQSVRHRRPASADLFRDLLLGHSKAIAHDLVGSRLFDWIQILTLQVLDQS